MNADGANAVVAALHRRDHEGAVLNRFVLSPEARVGLNIRDIDNKPIGDYLPCHPFAQAHPELPRAARLPKPGNCLWDERLLFLVK